MTITSAPDSWTWGAALAALALGCTGGLPTLDRAFVSETATATLAVVNLDQGRVEGRVEVGLLPHNLVLSPDGHTLYAALAGSQAVAVVDTRSATLRETWLTAPVPERRPDGTVIQPHLDRDAFAHTTCYDCHRDGGARPRYVGGRPVALRLSADGARLYVAHLDTAELVLLDTATGTRLAATTLAPVGEVREPAALDLLGDELLVTVRARQPSRTPGLVRRLDAATLQPLGTLPSGVNPVELRRHPERGTALVTHFDADLLTELGPEGARGTLTVASGPLGITPLPGGKALVLGYYSNAVSLVDLRSREVATWPLRFEGRALVNPTHAAVGTDPRVAWVVQSGTDARLVALDLETHEVTRTLPVNGLSYDVAIVPGSALNR